MSQLNAKGALGKKPSVMQNGPDVFNRKKMVAPRLLKKVSQQMQQKKNPTSSHDPSISISRLLNKPSSASTPAVHTPLISSPKNTVDSSVKSTTSASLTEPTTTHATPQSQTSNTTTTAPTITAFDTLDSFDNTSSRPDATHTSPVNTNTTNPDDHLQESDVPPVSKSPDGRIVVTVINKVLLPTDKCATVISDSFAQRVDPDGYRWASVSQATKDLYWEEFKKNCYWEEQDEAKVMTAWKSKASLAYSQYVFNMRNPQRNKHKKKPSHVSLQVWTSWWEKWNSEDFKKISDQNKVNRRNGVPDAPARPTHTSGSASHLKIASKLKRSLGCEPAHNREIHASYLEKREEFQATGEEVDDDSIFYEVVGGHDRKRRLYGFGSYGKLIPSQTGSNDTCYTPEPNVNKQLAEKNAELAQMKELVTTQKEQIEELKELVKNQGDQLKTQNEQSKTKIDKLEQQLNQFFASLKEKSTD